MAEIRQIVILEPHKRRKLGWWREDAGLQGDNRMQNVGFEKGHFVANRLIFAYFQRNSG